MAIKKVEIRPKGDGTYPDVLYPKTSVDQVDGLQTILNGKTDTSKTFLVSEQYLSGSTTNFNTLTTSGIYKIGATEGATGRPPMGYGILEVYEPETSYVRQDFISFSGEGVTRFSDNGGLTWSAWRQFRHLEQTYQNWNAGYDTYTRFPGNCKTITDWNTAVLNGMYMASGASNAPDGAWYIGTVIAHNDAWVVQKLMAFTDTNAEMREYERTKVNGAWQPWIETSPRKAFTGVVNGKTALASAISDKGVYTSPVETFANMSNNIRAIPARKFASGTTISQVGTTFQYAYPASNVSQASITVSGLNFKPSMIHAYVFNSNYHYNTMYNKNQYEEMLYGFATGTNGLSTTTIRYNPNAGNAYVTNGGFCIPVHLNYGGYGIYWFAYE